jgi:hypothetical protein
MSLRALIAAGVLSATALAAVAVPAGAAFAQDAAGVMQPIPNPPAKAPTVHGRHHATKGHHARPAHHKKPVHKKAVHKKAPHRPAKPAKHPG